MMSRASRCRPPGLRRRGRDVALVALVALVAGASVTLVGPGPAAAQGADRAMEALDRASGCLRRGDAPCALREADQALARPGEDARALRREALAVRASALARLDRADDAEEAFGAVIAAWPGWRPAPDDDPRVNAAFEGAHRAQVTARLPRALSPGPPPLPPPPTPEALAPPPFIYAPSHLRDLDPDEARDRRFMLSLGAGVAVATGAAGKRLDPGIEGAIELGWRLSDALTLWSQLVLALLPLDDAVSVEPGYARGLSTVSGAVGLLYEVEIAHRLDVVAALGVGVGAFGIERLGDVVGPAGHAVLGLRYRADEHLAFRVDFAPSLIVSTVDGVGPGGHLAFIARGETRF